MGPYLSTLGDLDQNIAIFELFHRHFGLCGLFMDPVRWHYEGIMHHIGKMGESSSWILRCKKIQKMSLSGILWVLKITLTCHSGTCTTKRLKKLQG